jgi:hypothetical protein
MVRWFLVGFSTINHKSRVLTSGRRLFVNGQGSHKLKFNFSLFDDSLRLRLFFLAAFPAFGALVPDIEQRDHFILHVDVV